MSAGTVDASIPAAVASVSAPTSTRYLRVARIRLTIWYVGVLFILLLIAGVSVYLVLAQVRAETIDSDLRTVAAQTADTYAAELEPRGPVYDATGTALVPTITARASRLDSQGAYSGPYPDVFELVLDTQRFVAINPRNVAIGGLPDEGGVSAAQTGRADIRTVHKGGQKYRLLSQLLKQAGEPVGVLQVGESLRPYENEQHDAALVLVAAGVAALALAALGGMIVAGRALRPAQLSWQRQQAFVADASHELRTPLALIRANAEVLLRSPERPVAENRDLVEDIVVEADHMSVLVTDMLVLARLDAGHLPLRREELDAGRLLKEFAARAGRLLDGRDIRIVVRTLPGITVFADRERIVQVLRILVDNAQRYVDAGGTITLRAQRMRGHVRLSVADTGDGIAPEHLERVFERFYRVDQARGRSEGGAGLGLAIARGIVEAHGGRLILESRLGHGTTAIIELPAAY
jgi:signal transduction histidine kinase